MKSIRKGSLDWWRLACAVSCVRDTEREKSLNMTRCSVCSRPLTRLTVRQRLQCRCDSPTPSGGQPGEVCPSTSFLLRKTPGTRHPSATVVTTHLLRDNAAIFSSFFPSLSLTFVIYRLFQLFFFSCELHCPTRNRTKYHM